MYKTTKINFFYLIFYENIFRVIPHFKKFLPIMICIFILNIFSKQDKKPEAQLQALMVKLIF